MIRIIVESRSGFPDGVAGPPKHETFDVDAPALEAHLRAEDKYTYRAVIGAELVNSQDPIAT